METQLAKYNGLSTIRVSIHSKYFCYSLGDDSNAPSFFVLIFSDRIVI